MGRAVQARVLAGNMKTLMPQAAFANGTLGHALDFDSTLFRLIHPSSPTVPAILAAAEHFGASDPMSSPLTAYVTAVELQRLAALGWSAGQGFHKPGIVGMLGVVCLEKTGPISKSKPPVRTAAISDLQRG